MDRREIVRTWLIDAKYGVIGPGELVARADRAIGELDTPPDYLLALSLGEPLHRAPRLDLVRDPVTQWDLGGLAQRLLERLESESLSLADIAVIATRVSFPRVDEARDALAQFDWISDEAHLIDEGAGDGTGFRECVVAALREAAKFASA